MKRSKQNTAFGARWRWVGIGQGGRRRAQSKLVVIFVTNWHKERVEANTVTRRWQAHSLHSYTEKTVVICTREGSKERSANAQLRKGLNNRDTPKAMARVLGTDCSDW